MARRKLEEMSYYELLGVDVGASADRVKQAFHAFARKYHPDRHRDEPELRDKSIRIYRRGTEAYRVLSNPSDRRLYDQGLEQGRVRFDPSLSRASVRPGAASLRPEASSGRTRALLDQAEQAIRARDYERAELHLRLALRHEPDNRVLRARLDRVRLASRSR